MPKSKETLRTPLWFRKVAIASFAYHVAAGRRAVLIEDGFLFQHHLREARRCVDAVRDTQHLAVALARGAAQ